MKTAISFLCCLLFCFISASSCQTSEQMRKFSVNTEGYFEAQPERMNKDAVRLQGIILTKGKKVADRLIYEMQVEEIIRTGDTFANVTPRRGERVKLITLNNVRFKRNSKVILDAMSPLSRKDEILSLDMIND